MVELTFLRRTKGIFFFPSSQKKEVVSKLKNEPVKITFELSRELQTTSPDCLRYYNILFRRYLRGFPSDAVDTHYSASVMLKTAMCF